MNARKFQGGLSNEELAAAFAKKLPGVTPTDRELSAFALGIEVGESLCHEAEQARWIPVSERMPETGSFVLALVRKGDRTRRIRAFYAIKGTIESGADDGDWIEYDEARDEYYLPAGWYEANEFEETHWHVTDPVTRWMPLPEAPPEYVPQPLQQEKP